MATTKGKGFRVNFKTDAYVRGKEAAFKRGLLKGAILLEGEIKRVLSKPGPMKSRLTAGQRRALEKAGETRRASLPGEPPRKRTGNLRSSIGHAERENGMVQRVGSSLAYARSLEWGLDPYLAPRPFFRPTVRRLTGAITALIARELKRGKT